MREARRASIGARCEQCGPDSLLLFNHGVLLEDLGEPGAALDVLSDAPSMRIRSWRTAITTSRGCTSCSASRSTPSAISDSTGGWLSSDSR